MKHFLSVFATIVSQLPEILRWILWWKLNVLGKQISISVSVCLSLHLSFSVSLPLPASVCLSVCLSCPLSLRLGDQFTSTSKLGRGIAPLLRPPPPQKKTNKQQNPACLSQKIVSYSLLLHCIFAECRAGYYGDNCSTECSSGCQSSQCHHVTGICSEGCLPGWLGEFCNQRKCFEYVCVCLVCVCVCR